jgi:hypothetical protein
MKEEKHNSPKSSSLKDWKELALWLVFFFASIGVLSFFKEEIYFVLFVLSLLYAAVWTIKVLFSPWNGMFFPPSS